MDVASRDNKDFIHQALNKAVQHLGDTFDVEVADRITVEQGMKGSPAARR